MLSVDEVILRELRIGLIAPFRTSRVVTTHRRVCVLEFRRDGETKAWSECVAGELPDYTGETIDTAWHALTTWLLPAVIGRHFRTAAEVEAAMEGVRDHRMARAAVEMGFQAMAAQAAGLSLAGHLGATRDRVACGASLGIDEDFDRLAERAERAVSEGYQRVKLKIEPGRSYQPLRRVRDAIGPDVPLAADANGAYAAADQHELSRLDELSLLLLEQPLSPRDFAGHARLHLSLRTPVCLDESIESPDDVRTMLALGAGGVVNIKPGRVGGLGAAVRIHDICRKHSLPVFCGGMLETGLGRAYNRALAALPGFELPGDLYPPLTYLEADIVTEFPLSDGAVEVPSTQGLGVEVDAELVEALAVRSDRVS